jgi:hypothetical protein
MSTVGAYEKKAHTVCRPMENNENKWNTETYTEIRTNLTENPLDVRRKAGEAKYG